jgi:hypothetical protein
MVLLSELKNSLIFRYKDIKYVYCPAIKQDVYFTLKGFKHLLGQEKYQKPRRTKEVIDRLMLILAVPHILERMYYITEHRFKNITEYVGFVTKI